MFFYFVSEAARKCFLFYFLISNRAQISENFLIRINEIRENVIFIRNFNQCDAHLSRTVHISGSIYQTLTNLKIPSYNAERIRIFGAHRIIDVYWREKAFVVYMFGWRYFSRPFTGKPARLEVAISTEIIVFLRLKWKCTHAFQQRGRSAHLSQG